jgi:hypothetical protein
MQRRTSKIDLLADKEEAQMEATRTQQRVQRMIRECRALGIEPDSRTIAEIMVDDDVTAGKYEDHSPEWGLAFGEYTEAARRELGRFADRSTLDKRRRA